jgi:glucokinase
MQEMISTKNRVVGVDISNEHTTYAIVDVRGNIIVRADFPTRDYPNINEYVAELSRRIIEMTENNGGYDTIRSIGISSPSANFLTGCIENAPNLIWKGVVPLAAMLRDRLGMAVGVANDAHVTALGEHAFGSAHGMQNFVVVSLGYGIGSCIFSHGEAHLGYNGFAGEFGHTCAVPNGRLCGCGNRGCVEAYCGAKGIVLTAQEVMAESDKPSLMRGVEKLTPRLITEFCDQGDELSLETYRRTGHILGVSVASFATITNPEAIIFTGGIANAGKYLFEPTFEAFDSHVFHNVRGKIKFLRSTIDDRERDVLGASALAWGIKEYSLFK